MYFNDIQTKIPFGTELEIAGFNILKNEKNQEFLHLKLPYEIDTNYENHKTSRYEKWLFTKDVTISDGDKGVEVISPISIWNPEYCYQLFQICNFLEEREGYVDSACGFHIHIDFRLFRLYLKSLKKLILFYAYFEPELNRFFAGEQQEKRWLALFCATDISTTLYKMMNKVICFFKVWINLYMRFRSLVRPMHYVVKEFG